MFFLIKDSSILMGNEFHAPVHGVGMVDLKFTSGKIVRLRNMHHVPSINKNLVSGSLLCRDMCKVVLESNKVVVPKYRILSLFRFYLSDFCNKSVNPICGNINRD